MVTFCASITEFVLQELQNLRLMNYKISARGTIKSAHGELQNLCSEEQENCDVRTAKFALQELQSLCSKNQKICTRNIMESVKN